MRFSGTQPALFSLAPDARPLVKWAGGKRALLPVIMANAPKSYDSFVEPFLGGAAVFLAFAPERAILNDANRELIQLYEAVRDDPAGVAAALDALQPYVSDPVAYYRIRSTDPQKLGPCARAARFIFLNKTGYNGLYRVNRRGEFNVPFGSRPTPPRLYDRDNLMAVAALLRNAVLRCGDFEAVLDQVEHGAFVYADPPYVPTSVTANFTRYTRSDFTLEDQERLASAVRRAARRGAKILVSNSDTRIVHMLYSDFTRITIPVQRRINSDATRRSGITEVLIRTYD